MAKIITLNSMCVFSHSVMSHSFADPWTVAHQGPLSMEFPRQEYWSGLPFPFPGDLPEPGIKSKCPGWAGRLFTTEPLGKPICNQQKKTTHPAALTPNFAYKNVSLETIWEFMSFEHELHVFHVWRCNKSLSTPKSNLSICFASLCTGHMNLHLATRKEEHVVRMDHTSCSWLYPRLLD